MPSVATSWAAAAVLERSGGRAAVVGAATRASPGTTSSADGAVRLAGPGREGVVDGCVQLARGGEVGAGRGRRATSAATPAMASTIRQRKLIGAPPT